jgi:eukaryotic-like serine/threonine-protein kinase
MTVAAENQFCSRGFRGTILRPTMVSTPETLTSGTKLGPYEILGLLGAGGMGEVYRARDTKLNRDVALKILPANFSSNGDRMARFSREAQVLAALNHPHIAAIYGLEDANNIRALVMELVEGPTLAERIQQGPIPVPEVLLLGFQIAEAVEAAHEKEIVHRDLKPANVKLTSDGKVKVLDFGLAKATERQSSGVDLANSPTLTAQATQAGTVLGTAAYMSPEQAKGKVVDRRTDIWAFGVLIWEMLTGRSLFSGDTASEVMAAVIMTEPRWSELPGNTPLLLQQLLKRCLKKDPRMRLRDIGDARLAITDILSGSEDDVTPIGGSTPRSGIWRSWAWCTGGFVAAAILGGALWSLRPTTPKVPLRKFEIAIAKLQTSGWNAPIISPDGTKVAFVSGGALRVREFDRLEARELVRNSNLQYPMWSPDSKYLAFVADAKLWKVLSDGGAPAVIAQAGFNRGILTPGGVWRSDGSIIFAPAASGSGLLSVPAQGGDFTSFLEPDPARDGDFHKPCLLPDNRGILYVLDRKGRFPDSLEVLTGKTRKLLLRIDGEFLDSPSYSPSGHIVFWRRSTNPGIWAVPFSLAKLQVTGEPFLLVPNAEWPSVAADGTLMYAVPGTLSQQIAWVKSDGTVEKTLTKPFGPLALRSYGGPKLSRDGARIAYTSDDGAEGLNVNVLNLHDNVATRLTLSKGRFEGPVWFPDGKHLAYIEEGTNGNEEQTKSVATDGSGEEQTIVQGLAEQITADGKTLIFSQVLPKAGFEIYTIALDPVTGKAATGATPQPLVEGPGNQMAAALSPDGHFLAYTSNESGHYKLYLTTFPRSAAKWQVSPGTGSRPVWSRDGARLYYPSDEGLMEVKVKTRPVLSIGTPRLLFSAEDVGIWPRGGFDVTADEKQFLMLVDVKEEKARLPVLTIVQNWFAEYGSNLARLQQ